MLPASTLVPKLMALLPLPRMHLLTAATTLRWRTPPMPRLRKMMLMRWRLRCSAQSILRWIWVHGTWSSYCIRKSAMRLLIQRTLSFSFFLGVYGWWYPRNPWRTCVWSSCILGWGIRWALWNYDIMIPAYQICRWLTAYWELLWYDACILDADE